MNKTLIFLGILIFTLLLALSGDIARVSAKANLHNWVKTMSEQVKKLPAESKTPKTSAIVQSMKVSKKQIVIFKNTPSAQELDAFEQKYEVTFQDKKKLSKNRYKITLNTISRRLEIERDPAVKLVVNDDSYKVTAQSTDWGIYKMNAEAAWGYVAPNTGANVVVGLIDTGVQLDHPDLSAAIQAGGYDFVNDDNDPTDDYGHGTAMAGYIAATNNSVGTVGAAYGAKILPFKACDDTGSCDTIAIVDSIDAAIAADVDIINMSFGGSANSYIQEAVNRATAAGIIVAGAAGNENASACLYPAAYANAVCVGAIDSSDDRGSFSNYGTGLDVVAPGVSNNTTGMLSSYISASGTSGATAYYSGAAAQIVSSAKAYCAVYPSDAICSDLRSFTQTVLNIIIIRDIGTPGYDSYFGYGAIDLSQMYSDTTVAHTTPTTVLKSGTTYPQPITFKNDNSYSIALSSCTIDSNNVTRAQTTSPFAVTQLAQDATIYSTATGDQRYTRFAFPTPIAVAGGATINFSYNYSLSAESQPNDTIYYAFLCEYDNEATGSITESYRSEPGTLSSTVSLPDALQNVRFVMKRLQYGTTVTNYSLTTYDRVYLKYYDSSKVRLTNFYFYEYQRNRNHAITRIYKTSTSFDVKVRYLVPRGRQYAWVAEFQDRATGLKKKYYFNFYTRL